MRFNDGYERKRFIKEHEKMREEYRKAGMSDEQIDEIFLYDWDRYREQRNYCLHNRYIREYEDFGSTTIEEELYMREDSWYEGIEDLSLYVAIMSLTEEQRRILWLYAFEGLTQKEIAEIFGISHSAVRNRMEVIRKKIRRVLND